MRSVRMTKHTALTLAWSVRYTQITRKSTTQRTQRYGLYSTPALKHSGIQGSRLSAYRSSFQISSFIGASYSYNLLKPKTLTWCCSFKLGTGARQRQRLGPLGHFKVSIASFIIDSHAHTGNDISSHSTATACRFFGAVTLFS